MKNIKLLLLCFVLISMVACKSAYNKGVTNTKDFKPNNPPSSQIKAGYDKTIKKSKRGTKSLKGKEGKALEKAKMKLTNKKLKKDKRYMKRRKRLQKREH